MQRPAPAITDLFISSKRNNLFPFGKVQHRAAPPLARLAHHARVAQVDAQALHRLLPAPVSQAAAALQGSGATSSTATSSNGPRSPPSSTAASSNGSRGSTTRTTICAAASPRSTVCPWSEPQFRRPAPPDDALWPVPSWPRHQYRAPNSSSSPSIISPRWGVLAGLCPRYCHGVQGPRGCWQGGLLLAVCSSSSHIICVLPGKLHKHGYLQVHKLDNHTKLHSNNM